MSKAFSFPENLGYTRNVGMFRLDVRKTAPSPNEPNPVILDAANAHMSPDLLGYANDGMPGYAADKQYRPLYSGFAVDVSCDVPKGEVWFVRDGEVVTKIVNIGEPQ